MPSNLTLIQLISEQTMQNLVPLLALKPARVIHLATPKTAGRSAHIVEAARQAQVNVCVENIRLSEMPTIPETSRAVLRAIGIERERASIPVVNFTGGTKLMSIGAYEAALREQAVSLYVDTDHQQFLDGHTGPKLNTVLGDDFSFTSFQQTLTVNTIAVANGRERVTDGRDWAPLLPLARHMWERPATELAVHEACYGKGGLMPRGQTPRSPDQWLQLLDRTFTLPVEIARLALEVGLIRPGADGTWQLPDAPRAELQELADSRARNTFVPDYDPRRIAATDLAQFPMTFLTGGWWEVMVAAAFERSGLFRDIRWSAVTGERNGADLEEDLLAVDGVQIACISCKRGGSGGRLLPHLEEFNARARRLGGNFTRRFLALYFPPQGKSGANIRQRATELGIRLLTPADLSKPDAFARSGIRG